MTEQRPEKSQTTMGLNPARIQVHSELLAEEALAVSLRAKKRALESQHADLHDQLLALNAQEVYLSQLELEAQRLESNYRAYWENREQARIDQLLQLQRISNVNIIQPPAFMPKPVSPKKPLIGVLGLVFAVFGSLSFAYLSDYLDDSMKTPEDVERKLGLPVLVAIPAKRIRSERLEVRRPQIARTNS